MMNHSARFKLLALLTGITVSLATCLFLFTSADISRGEAGQSAAPKYVFIFLADGGGITHMEIVRMFNRHLYKEGLVIHDRIMKEGHVGLLTTHAADSLVTDSPAAGTALACGCKAKTGVVGMCEDGSVPKSVMELAKEKGMRIGLVTTATVYDASPAAFASHVSNRRLYGSIIDQYLKLEPDLLLGGGREQFLPRSQGGRRKDDSDMIASFKKKGYAYVSERQGLAQIKGGKLLGLFSLRDMSFELDRDKNTEPSLSEMTQAALRILPEGNRTGFVAFIENENTDSAGHMTDIASLIHAYREFDRAVGLAYEFYKKHPAETLLLVTSDHETGGLAFSGKPSFEDLKRIQSVRISLAKAAEILGQNPSAEAVDQLVAENFKGFVLQPELKESIIKKRTLGPPFTRNPTAAALSAMVASQTQAYWISSGHTNQPVFVAALGVGSERFRGYQDNTDFAKHLFALLDKKQ
ncbi:MAG: alkaline phosphatase [Deltaproteobacteria bacterium]|nr:alkaline phosphatase [Deltaproteobacteria bacterium]